MDLCVFLVPFSKSKFFSGSWRSYEEINFILVGFDSGPKISDFFYCYLAV